MTSYPISAPPLTPATEGIELKHHQTAQRSPFTGHVTVVQNYSEWIVEIGFPPLRAGSSAAKAFLAWRDSLRGEVGTFLYQPHGSGVAITGKTLAGAGNATANEILVGGWTASAASGLSAGDYLSINNALFRIVSAPANANGSGQCTISVEPRLKATFTSGTAVNFATPTTKLRLANSDDQTGYSRDCDAIRFPTLRAVEAI